LFDGLFGGFGSDGHGFFHHQGTKDTKRTFLDLVVPGLVPGIHAEPPASWFQPAFRRSRVDGRNKSGQDGKRDFLLTGSTLLVSLVSWW